jgi:transcriptional regulator with XRE-family HTH domain
MAQRLILMDAVSAYCRNNLVNGRVMRRKIFAEKAGITPAELSAFIGGKRDPTINHKIKLSKALGIPVEGLFPGE